MRSTPNYRAERCRISGPPRMNCGAFLVSISGVELRVIASDAGGWDHVSVSLAHRCPTWAEMEAVRELFFHDDEWALQYSPPRGAKINHHPYCLHWWRPQTEAEIAAIVAQFGLDPDFPNAVAAGPIPVPPRLML